MPASLGIANIKKRSELALIYEEFMIIFFLYI